MLPGALVREIHTPEVSVAAWEEQTLSSWYHSTGRTNVAANFTKSLILVNKKREGVNECVQRGKCWTVKGSRCGLCAEKEAFPSNHGSAQLCQAVRQGLAFLQCHTGSCAQRKQSSMKQNFLLVASLSEIWFPIMTWFPFPVLAPASLCQPFKMFNHMAAQSCTISQSLQVRKERVSNCCQQILSHNFPCLSCHSYRCQPGFFTASFFSSTLKKKKVGGKSKKEELCISSSQALKWKMKGIHCWCLLIPPPLLLHHCSPLSMTKWAPQAWLCKPLIPPLGKGVFGFLGYTIWVYPAFDFVSVYRGRHFIEAFLH